MNPVEYQGKLIGFVGDRINGANPTAIMLEDAVWNWMTANFVEDIVQLTSFFHEVSNRGLMYTPKHDVAKVDMKTPMVLMIPAGLVEWMLTTLCTP